MLRLRNDLYCVEWGVKLYSLTRLNICFRVSEHEYVIYKTIEATVFPNMCMPLTEDVQGRLQL